MECAKQFVGKLIGRGGETIQLIQQKSGCKVQVNTHHHCFQQFTPNLSQLQR
jgi:rRNA processing protein Krr1/Pno1